MAPPSSFNSTAPEGDVAGAEEAMTEEPASAPGPIAMREGSGSGETEATPSWTSSSSGSVECLAAEVIVPISLKDRTFLQPGDVGVTVEVRNPETGGRDSPADHDLATTFMLRGPSGNMIEEGDRGYYKSLVAGVRIFSAYVPRTIVGATEPSGPTCEEIWEGILQERFVLTFSYRRGEDVYRGAPDGDSTPLPPGQPPLLLDPVVLAPITRN